MAAHVDKDWRGKELSPGVHGSGGVWRSAAPGRTGVPRETRELAAPQSPHHARLLATPWTAPPPPGLPVFRHLPQFAQVHFIYDAIQPSHPLMPSSSALSLSQHQGLLQ